MKFTVNEMLILLDSLNARVLDMNKTSNAAELAGKQMCAKMWKDEAEKAKALRDKIISNLDEITI